MATNDTDEDFISCHVCLFRYDNGQRKPKFLDCHHSFCTSCIKDLSVQKQRVFALRNFENGASAVTCPTCRHPTDLSGKNIEELATNNLALRLLAIETKKAEEAVALKETGSNLKKSKMWCVDCESLGSALCQNQSHIMYEYQQVYNEQLILLEGQANLCRPHFQKAIEERQVSQLLYLQAKESLQCLMADINRRIEANDSQIAMVQSTMQEISDVPIIPSNDDSSDEEYLSTIEQMKSVAARFALLNNEASTEKTSSLRQLNVLKRIEDSRLELKWNKMLKNVGLLKELQLSFSGGDHADPKIKACVSALTYLILLLTEQDGDSLNGERETENSDPDPSPDVSIPEDDTPKQTVPSQSFKNTGARPKFARKQNKCDSPSAFNKFKGSQTVPKSIPPVEKISSTKYFFRFSLNGEITKQVVIQLEPEAAPLMCHKFASLCSGKDCPGYRGSSIFKVVKNYSITGGFVESKTDKEWRRKFFYIADRSSLPEKRGCVRMHINRIVDWKAEVSTEFLIILSDRMEQRKFTTVFGYVIDGLAVCEKISQLNLEKMNIVIAECGPC